MNVAYVQGGGNELPEEFYCGFEGTPACSGDGTVYRFSGNLVKTFGFAFSRVSGGKGHIFAHGTSVPGSFVRAYYDYRTGRGGLGKGPGDQPGMPGTGGGGTAAGWSWSLPLSAAILLLTPFAALVIARRFPRHRKR